MSRLTSACDCGPSDAEAPIPASRLEQRSDLLISTLRSYVEAMGGRLTLVAEFPDRKPVVLSGIAALDTDPTPTRMRARHAKASAG